jgi:hypothetical protein
MIRLARLIGVIVALTCAVEHGAVNLGADAESISLGFPSSNSIIQAPHSWPTPGDLRALRSRQESVGDGHVRPRNANDVVSVAPARVPADRFVTSVELGGRRPYSSPVAPSRAGRGPPHATR